jgi:hypothetical protein
LWEKNAFGDGCENGDFYEIVRKNEFLEIIVKNGVFLKSWVILVNL